MAESPSANPANANPSSSPGLRAHTSRVSNYFKRMHWFVGDALASRKRELFIIAGITIASASAQAGTLGLLAYFINRIQHRGDSELPLLGTVIGNNAPTLTLMTLSIFGLSLFAAISAYRSAARIRRIARSHHEFSLRRILVAYGDADLSRARQGATNHADLQRLALVGSRMMGMAIEGLLRLIQPLFYCVAATIVLLSLDAGLTLMIAPFTLAMLPFLYMLGRSLKESAQSFYGSATREMALETQRLVQFVGSTNVHPSFQRAQVEAVIRASAPIANYRDVHDQIMLANNRAQLITSAFRSFFIAFALILLGYNALHNLLAWGSAIAYIVALGQLMNQLQQGATTASMVNRFYPQIALYANTLALFNRLEASAPRPQSGAISSFHFRTGEQAGARTTGEEIHPGNRVLLFTPHRLDRVALPSLLSLLREGSTLSQDSLSAIPFVAASFNPVAATCPANLLPEPATRAALWRSLEKQLEAHPEARSEFATLPVDESDDRNEGFWDSLTSSEKALLRIAPLIDSPPSVVLLDAALLEHCARAARNLLLALLSRHTLICCTSSKASFPDWVDHFAVADETKILGAGDRAWGAGNLKNLASAASSRASETVPTVDPESDLADQSFL